MTGRAVGLALALWAAGGADAQDGSVLQRVAEARRLHDEGRSEDAAVLLRDARRDAAATEDVAVRRRLEKAVDVLLGEVDTLDDATQKAMEAAAKAMLKPAQSYLRRRWYLAALPILEEVAALSAKVGAKALDDARSAAGGGDRRGSAGDGIDGWFKDGKTFAGGGYWKVADGVVESPAIGSDSVGFRSERRTEGDVRVRVEVLASESPSKASMVFAMDPSKNGDDYYILELRHEKGFSQLRLLHNAASGNLDELVTQYVAMSRAERAAWTELWVELRGDRIRIGVGDLESAETRSVTPDLDGSLGFFVSGDSPFKAPVRFRGLAIEKL